MSLTSKDKTLKHKKNFMNSNLEDNIDPKLKLEIEKNMLKVGKKELREEFKDATAEDIHLIMSHQLALDMKKTKRLPIINERLIEYFKLSNPSSIEECKLLLIKYAIILNYVQKNRLLEIFPNPCRGFLLIYLHLRDKLEELQGHKIVIPDD
jgi:hypothetical protein